MDRKDKAIELHHKGFNCAQSVVMAYCDLFDMDKKSAMRASEGFGAGMGSFTQVCGALSGAVMLAGLKNSDADVENGPKSKRTTYESSKQLVEEFKSRCGALNCCDLKAGRRVSCDDCITCAAEIVEENLL